MLKPLKKITGTKECFDYAVKLFAWVIQNPDKKPGICMVCTTPQGAGKNSFIDFLCKRVIGMEYSNPNAEIDDVLGKYNYGTLFGKKMVYINELHKYAGYKKFGRFKSLITDNNISYEEKYVAKFTAQNINFFVIGSNERIVAKIEPGDRRFFVTEGTEILTKKEANDFHRIEKDMGAAVYKYLSTIDLEDFDLKQDMPCIDLKKDQMDINKNPAIQFMDDIENGEIELHSFVEKDGEIVVHPDNLFAQYREWKLTQNIKMDESMKSFKLTVKSRIKKYPKRITVAGKRTRAAWIIKMKKLED